MFSSIYYLKRKFKYLFYFKMDRNNNYHNVGKRIVTVIALLTSVEIYS